MGGCSAFHGCFCSSIQHTFMSYMADSVVLSVHAQPSFPLPVPGHKLSPDAGVISQSPHSKTEVLGNSHPPRSHPQPMVGVLVDKPPTPSPYRWGNSEVCVYTGSQKASSGNLIEHTFPGCLFLLAHSFHPASNLSKLFLPLPLSQGLLLGSPRPALATWQTLFQAT